MQPDPVTTLRAHFGFDFFRPGQQEAIHALLNGQHTLVVMPTGAGKSLIFQLAALQLSGITLVISPLIALMKNQVDSLARRNIPAAYINSALPACEQTERLGQLASGKYRLVYVAPERLRSTAFLDVLRRQPISLLAVDEAHCISEWGHDFRPDYLHIAQWRNSVSPHLLTVALTATATPQVQDDILRLLGLGDSPTRIVTGFNRPNLSLNVTYTSGLPAKLRALNGLLSASNSGSVIIYTGTRRDAEEVAEFAHEVAKLPAEHYHAGLPAEQRTRIQNDFISGKLNVIAATNAFGMGIDRADVRQVIHYSLPGSLEAYYQEAGRAGRDGLPARVTLLYDPKDRALHEFFIQQGELASGDLRALHNAVRGGEGWTMADDLSRVTGLHPVQVRVGLSALESAGALEHLGDEGLRMMYRKGALNPLEIEKAIQRSKLHLQHRQEQLDGMVHYAESNHCRRKIILDHFGDAGAAEAADCCDNCREMGAGAGYTKEPAQMNHGERAALVILDCIRRLKIKVGRRKLAQILHGSKAQDILKFHHDKNLYYGRLVAVKQVDIETLVGQLVEKGYIKVVGGEYPVVSLTPRGENAIRQKESIALVLPRSLDANALRRAKAKLEAGGTLEYTARLFAEGLKPEQIARERGLAATTVYGHLAQLIERGEITVEQVVPAGVREKIERAIEKVGSAQYLMPIKALLPESISFEQIRCVVAQPNPRWFQDAPLPTGTVALRITSNATQIWERILECVRSLPGQLPRSGIAKILVGSDSERVQQYQNHPLYNCLPDARRSEVMAVIDEMLMQGLLAHNENGHIIILTSDVQTPDKESPDPIASFLNTSHPRPLTGSWQCGWSLGFHSRFSGGDWARSGIGDLTYRLKYEGDQTALPALVAQTLELFQNYPELAQVDAILPVPPSTPRASDPVLAFCHALAGKMELPAQAVLVKTRQTEPQKALHTLAQKCANVSGAFALCGDVKGKRLLLIDDLFDSGATLEEITRLLQRHGAARVHVLTLTRTIHSDL